MAYHSTVGGHSHFLVLMSLVYDYSALWVMQSTTGLRLVDCINKSGLIKGSKVFWLILQSQIFITFDFTGFILIQ